MTTYIDLPHLGLSIYMTGFDVQIKKRKSSKYCKENSIKDDIEVDENNTDSEDELNITNNPFVGGGNKLETESDCVMSDQTYEDMGDELNIDENDEYYEDESWFHSFLPNHP